VRPLTAAALALAFGAALFSACGDVCGELQEICDRCNDPNRKAACETTVDEGVSDQCDRGVESYRVICK
jgi:hypothetical protein